MQTIYRKPFSIGAPLQIGLPHGSTVADAVRGTVPGVPHDVLIVTIGDTPIPSPMWDHVRPKAGTDVVIQHLLRGGGDDGKGVALFAAIASIGIAVFSAGIASGGAASLLGPKFAAGTTGAYALAGAASIAGSFLLQALMPSPSLGRGPETTRRDQGAASAQGNILEANGPIPRVIGTRKLYPPFATQPFYERDGSDEYVEAIYALAGPHDLSDIQIDGTPIEEAEDVQFEVREGWNDDAPLDLVTRQARVGNDNIELSVHKPDADDSSKVVSGADVPFWHGVSTGVVPDKINIHMVLPQGMSKDGSTSTIVRVPFRIRIKGENDVDWRYLPEVHYAEGTISQTRFEIELDFFTDREPLRGYRIPTKRGFVEANLSSGLVDGYFIKGGVGNDYLTNSNDGSATEIQHVELSANKAVFYLDKVNFPDEKYAIEVIRGAVLLNDEWDATAATYRDDTINIFGISGVDIPEDRDGMLDTVYAVRSVSVWNEHPIKKPGLALIAVRARNRSIERLSVVASGYVKDWDGTDWATWAITSNPAPHFRDVLAGALNFDPVPEKIIDDASIVAWRARCAAQGYTCDHIAEGDAIDDLLRVIAGCGYGKPYQSETWGVIYDRDRSADAPVQIFSGRNSRGFTMRKSLGRLPDGLRINHPVNVGDNTNAQTVVYRPGAGGVRLDQVTYDGMLDADQVIARGEYDNAQMIHRNATYSLDAPAEAVICRRNSLVGVETDILSRQTASARVFSVQLSGNTIVGLTLDTPVEVYNTVDWLAVPDILAEPDVLQIGLVTGIAVRVPNGDVHVLEIGGATGYSDTLTVVNGPDISAVPVSSGDLVVVGLKGTEIMRMIVTEIETSADMVFSLSLVDEAPELWA